MRVAPPVQALSCSAGVWRSLQQGLVALSAGVAAGWAGAQLGVDGAALAAGALISGLAAAAWAGRRLDEPASRLAWDGAAWQLQRAPQGETQAGQAALMIDLGDWMLVRFMPGARWLPLSRRAHADWQALRVALHAVPPLRPGA